MIRTANRYLFPHVSSHRETSEQRTLFQAGGLYTVKERGHRKRAFGGVSGPLRALDSEGVAAHSAGWQVRKSVQGPPQEDHSVCGAAAEGLLFSLRLSPETPPGRTLTSGPPWLLVSQLLFIASCDFQIGQRRFMLVLLESLPMLFYSLASSFPWSSVLFVFICFYLFSFKCRIGWREQANNEDNMSVNRESIYHLAQTTSVLLTH